jgi:hypothetical protein
VGSRIHCRVVALALLIFLARTGWKGKITNWRQLCFVTSVALRCLALLSLFRCFGRCCSFCLSGRFREELLEVFEKIGSGVEEMCNLRIDVLDRLRLALIGLKDLKKLFIDLWSILESVLFSESAKISNVGFFSISFLKGAESCH